MFRHIYHWHQALIRKIATTFGLSDDLRHQYHLNHFSHSTRRILKDCHHGLHGWQKQHNRRVAEFHKHHALQIERGENGNGWLEKWERIVYSKGKALIKAAK